MVTRKKVTQVSNVILLIEHLVSFSFLTFLNELVRGAVISLMDIFERSSILTPMLIRYFTCGSIVSGTWHLRALMTCVCGRGGKNKAKRSCLVLTVSRCEKKIVSRFPPFVVLTHTSLHFFKLFLLLLVAYVQGSNTSARSQ